jgi:Asp-tRNA(Asn)/Glu-tRNA(Gln) amidotransferase A subunit family amidase
MLSLLDLLRRIDAGDFTPEGALRLCRDAVLLDDETIRAFVSVDHAATVGQSGPLKGIAVGVKDIIDTAEMPTEYGSSIYAGWRPKADATVVSLLKRAGATVLGKTATTAFAHLDPTETRNPRNLAHSPGGSSSGSAAAVAAGMIPLAVGTQTGGSVIRPASYCGITAIKPSFRVLPTVGIKTYSWSLDTPGLFAKSVDDVAFALAAMTGRDEVRVDGAEIPAPRIGVVLQEFGDDPEPDSAAALERAVRAAESAGAGIRPLPLPAALGDASRAHQLLQDFEAIRALGWEYDHHRDALPPKLRSALDEAQGYSGLDYDLARRAAHRARGVLGEIFNGVDALLTFSAPGPAPKGLGSTGNARFNRLWTLMGNPCVNVPCWTGDEGLPVGVQVIAAFGKDDKALAASKFIESAIRARDE